VNTLSDWIPNQGAAGLWTVLLGALIAFVVRVEVGLARLKSGHEAMKTGQDAIWKTRTEDLERHKQDEARRDKARDELSSQIKELNSKFETLSQVVLMAIKKD
jgi:hypothetical protein